MINKTEQEERAFLEKVKTLLRKTLQEITENIHKYDREIREQKKYLWDNKSGMDHVEKISVRQSVDQSVMMGDTIVAKSSRLQKLLLTPFFGRFDFIESGKDDQFPVYIGIHSFFDESTSDGLIYDWRAPISTMFYDYEPGPAQFESPVGTVQGEMTVKRQYRIRKGEMEFMIESDINIHDDILQKELSCAADDKMKNIVATIQRDQNAIIRNEHSNVLIIQGVAGSGKTSIALHRIAFLLYRFKDEIKSKDLLIISPNKVFADYISNVLPELGEETIPEIGIEELAKDLLNREYDFQSFFEQVSALLKNKDEAFAKRIQEKASFEFLKKFDEYIDHVKKTYFKSHEMRIKKHLVPAWFMKERFEQYEHLSIIRRLDKLVRDVVGNISIYYHYDVNPKEKNEIQSTIYKMFKVPSLKELYKDFYVWLEKPHLFHPMEKSALEYSDVFPLIYLKIFYDGIDSFGDVKHLLIDEMQDYTPIQYAVLDKLYPCKKTVLGDANQSVNPFSSSSCAQIQKVFEKADVVKLNKSYRSTFEITQFAQNISKNDDLEVVERHGNAPEIIEFKNKSEERSAIINAIREFKESDYHSLGIICKSEPQAQELHTYIKEKERNVYLLSHKSESFIQGVVICSAHMSKGLEFDQVIIPEVDQKNYSNEVDRKMLYISCTRAMHKLSLSHHKPITKLL